VKATSAAAQPLRLLSVVIPARDEETRIGSAVEHLHAELRAQGIPHEIVVVDDGSTDKTWDVLAELQSGIPSLRPIRNSGRQGYGRALNEGLNRASGDAFVILAADDSDDSSDVSRFWTELNKGYDCVFGSRFAKGGAAIDYPWLKLMLNRMANLFIRLVFRIKLNDTTNAFKAYRREAIEGCRPLISRHYNVTVELPLKAIVRGYTWTVIPVRWRNRRTGTARFRIREMGSRYFFICTYVWLEKHLSRGDYKKRVSA
jgi:dolichol-phosphate mannosyltransferase